jgi:hypothetical protein
VSRSLPTSIRGRKSNAKDTSRYRYFAVGRKADARHVAQYTHAVVYIAPEQKSRVTLLRYWAVQNGQPRVGGTHLTDGQDGHAVPAEEKRVE